MGNTQSVQSHNFQLIDGYKLEDIWRQFDEDSPYLNDNQLDLLYRIVPNRDDRDEMCKSFDVSDEYSLKHYMLELITKNEYLISYMDKQILKFYFGDTLYERLIELFPSYQTHIDDKLESIHDKLETIDEIDNKEHNIADIKGYIIADLIKIKDMRPIVTGKQFY